MHTHSFFIYSDSQNPHKTQVGTVVGTEAGTGRALGGHWVGTVTRRLGPICVARSVGGN